MADEQVLPASPTLDPYISRAVLVDGIVEFLKDRDPGTLRGIRESVTRELDAAGPQALAALGQRLATAGAGWTYNPPDPLARRLHHVIADRLLQPDSALVGIEHVRACEGRPVVIVANHLSYSDANLLEILLQRSGGAAMADRLTVIAGPKVYSRVKRRFSSLCFGTIKTPQSSARSSDEAVMNPRDVARAARRCIEIAHERLARGEALLVFVEGSRSRTTGMQQTLAAATRYFDGTDACLLPVGIVGTETLFPIDADTVHPVRIVVRAGPPIDAAALRARCAGNRREMMDAIGRAIADLLPPEYRGWYGR
jgi:1-acyl-sn-glycerol-3-phosphate acyltransferase